MSRIDTVVDHLSFEREDQVLCALIFVLKFFINKYVYFRGAKIVICSCLLAIINLLLW